jgi:VanZ family protein
MIIPNVPIKVWLSWILVIIWILLIYYMSSQVARTSSGLSSLFVEPIRPYAPGFTEVIITTLVRKSAHIFQYFVLGILVFNVLCEYKLSSKKLVGYSILFAGLYAITDEIHQAFVPGRSAELRDVFIDTIGASLGVLMFYGIVKFQNSRKKEPNDS